MRTSNPKLLRLHLPLDIAVIRSLVLVTEYSIAPPRRLAFGIGIAAGDMADDFFNSLTCPNSELSPDATETAAGLALSKIHGGHAVFLTPVSTGLLCPFCGYVTDEVYAPVAAENYTAWLDWAQETYKELGTAVQAVRRKDAVQIMTKDDACPFCQSLDVRAIEPGEYDDGTARKNRFYYVRCMSCGASGPAVAPGSPSVGVDTCRSSDIGTAWERWRLARRDSYRPLLPPDPRVADLIGRKQRR